MTWLLDGNVLIALAWGGHPFHARSSRWFHSLPAADAIATCPVTEGTLLRLHMHHGSDRSSAAAWDALARIHAHPRHIFWADNFSYTEIAPTRLTGHRQITDSWLAELARRQGGKLATLDAALHVLWPESTLLIPV
jgi:toxin-antitoxin system PIN domain toxin